VARIFFNDAGDAKNISPNADAKSSRLAVGRVGVPVGVPTPPDARSTADPRIFFSDAGEHANMSSNAPATARARSSSSSRRIDGNAMGE
jgi:hypothetical protein